MVPWQFFGLIHGARAGEDRALFERLLNDGTRLVARVGVVDGRPVCHEITATFPSGARNIGRELAIGELERAINDSDRHGVRDERTGTIVPLLSLSEIPVGVPVRGSRARESKWTDERLAALVDDLANGNSGEWHLSRTRIRELANQAVARGLAELRSTAPRRRWTLTAVGEAALSRSDAVETSSE